MNYNETKLIVFLKTFSKEELSEFEKFISSSYFKSGRDLSPFFNILKKYHPDFTSNDFNEQNIFRQLNPDLNYTEKKSKDILRTLSSSLLKAVEEFLFQIRIRNNTVLKNRMLMNELLDRNLHKYYEHYLQNASADIEKDEEISGKNFLEKFYIERLNTKYCSHILDFNKLFEHSLSALDLISSYFLLDLIRTSKTLYMGALNRSLIKENAVEKLLEALSMEKILKIYEGTPQYSYLCFNYYIYLCMKNNLSPEYYEKAKKIFFENKPEINRYDKNFFYSDLININMIKSSGGNFVSPDETFFLMKCCIEDKAYKVSDDDFMQPDFYRNVILVAGSAKEFNWADDFINRYSDELKPEFRDNMKYYSKALVQYGSGQYEESLENISKVKYDLTHFKIDVKILMLKIFFELELYEQAYSMTDTFRHYIKSSKVMRGNIKESYNNFLKYYMKILKLNASDNRDEEGLIKVQMENEKFLSHKRWLNEKLEDICAKNEK